MLIADRESDVWPIDYSLKRVSLFSTAQEAALKAQEAKQKKVEDIATKKASAAVAAAERAAQKLENLKKPTKQVKLFTTQLRKKGGNSSNKVHFSSRIFCSILFWSCTRFFSTYLYAFFLSLS